MAVLPIRTYGDPVLRETARPLEKGDIDEAFRRLIDNVAETMYEASGIGLAANQVGETRRFFVIDVAQAEGRARKGGKRIKNPERRELLVFLNPEILEYSIEDESQLEGCLSIPGVDADVFRPLRVKVRYRTLDWKEHVQWVDGLLARVFQHELDHLDGVLFVDRLPEAKRRKLAGTLNRLKNRDAEELQEAGRQDRVAQTT